jgi:glycosyltransferase involved in cell wall biosynthesis
MAVVNILLSHPSAELYGSDRMVLLAARGLVSRGHAVTAVLPSDGPLVPELKAAQISVIIADIPVLRKSDMALRPFLKLVWKIVTGHRDIIGLIRTVRPDVVYVNTIVQPWWISAGRLMRIPVVVHAREAEPQLRKLVKMVINAPLFAADVVICNSKSTRREILEFRPMSRKRLPVVYNGKDWSAFQGGGHPAAASSSAVRLTVIGRLSPRKGQDIAIRALAKLIAEGNAASLTLVGDVFPGYEWYEAELRCLTTELDVDDHVTFAGFQPDICPALAETDIAIVPSRIEPFGTVAAECMAAGVLTVASNCQGLTEIIEQGRNGLIFAADDSSALAQSCLWALNHPVEAKEMASRAQRDVEERFSLARYEQQVTEIIQSVVGSKRLRTAAAPKPSA